MQNHVWRTLKLKDHERDRKRDSGVGELSKEIRIGYTLGFSKLSETNYLSHNLFISAPTRGPGCMSAFKVRPQPQPDNEE
ncbi:hypothetical protein M8J76_016602 [Diaphorina citri]|nr:hypothetical protein M8J76_016602 [Diaphorina citri]